MRGWQVFATGGKLLAKIVFGGKKLVFPTEI